MKYKELLNRAKALYEEIESIALSPNADQAVIDEKFNDAKSLELQAEKLKQVEERKAALQAPVLPADLPVGTPEPPQESRRAPHLAKYTTEDLEVKAVTDEVYGTNYAEKLHDQHVAFTKFIRFGDRRLRYDEQDLLRNHIMNPAMVKIAIREGLTPSQIKATMVEATGTLGGYIVPADFQSNIVQRLPGLTVIRERADKLTTSRDSVSLAADGGGDDQYTSNVREYFVNEVPTGSTSETNLTWTMVDVPVHTAMASVPMSKNLIEDAAVNIVDHLSKKLAEAAGINEDNRFLTGDGVGKPQGILPGGSNLGTRLTEVVSGSAAALESWDALIGMTFGIASQYLPRAVWVGRRSTFQAIAKLKDGNGQYLWRTTLGDNVSGLNRTLLGFPVLLQESLPEIGANTYPLLFGDLGGYTIIDRVGMTIDRYDDATTAKTNTVEYVMRRRFGGQLLEAYRLCVMKIAAS